MPLAPQRSNPGSRGQNARYYVVGLPQDEQGRYFDGQYHYSGDPDNALSDDRPDSVVAGLFGADDDRSRDSQWRPGQPMPNRAAPRLIGQATRLVQGRRAAPSSPLSGSPAYRRAAGDVAPVIAGAASALIEALIGKATRSTREINTRTGAIASSLSGYGDKASGYYDDAMRGSRGVGDAVSAAIRGTGQALQGDIAGKLAGIQAPGAAVDLQAGGQARTGDAAAAAASGLSSAELERLKGTGAASEAMMGALPRIANLAGDQQRRGVLNQIGGELTDKLAELYGKQPGMILDAIEQQQKAEADARKQAALDRYRNRQLSQGQARINESKRYHDLQADLAAGRLTVSQFNAKTGRLNAQTGMARLDQKTAQDAQRNAQAWARIATGNQNAATAAANSQLSWEKFKVDPTGKSGGYTRKDIATRKVKAGELAKQAFKGYYALDDDPDTPLTQSQLLSLMKQHDVSSPAELDAYGVGRYQRSYQEAMSGMLGADIPLVIAQAALNRYWTKPGAAMPWEHPGAGRPKQSFQERNPKAGAGPSVGGPGIALPATFRPTHPTSNLGWPAVDIMGKPGTPVKSPVAGTVVRHGSAQGGEALYLDDDDPDTEPDYWIGHIEDRVPVGTRVRRGQLIASISGRHPRPHVHLARRM